MDQLRQDLQYALRGLRAAPGFALVAILSIGLGVGANTTVFSFVNGVFLAPLPFRDAERVVDVYEHDPTEVCPGCGIGTSYATYQTVRAASRTLVDAGAYGNDAFIVSGDNGPARVTGGLVTAGLLESLGSTLRVGRMLQPEDDRAGAPRVALISEALWETRFSSDPAILGRAIRLNGDAYTVVGVLTGGPGFPESAQVWIPLGQRASNARGDRDVSMLARVAHGIDQAQVQAELNTIAARLQKEYPQTNAGWTLHAMSLRNDLAGDFGGVWLVLAVVVFVLLVACANLAGLLLARGAARRRELGVRLSLGASRRRLIRQLLTESIVLALAGGVLGVLIAVWSIDALRTVTQAVVPYWANLQIDARVLAFTIALTMVTGILFGLLPALESSRVDLTAFLKEGGHGTSHGARASRLRRVLVAGEIAVSLVLFTGAALTAKTFLRARNAETGQDTRNLVRGDLRIMGSRFDNVDRRAAVIDRVLERTRRVNGVRDVTATSLIIADWPEIEDRGVQVDGVADEIANRVVHHMPTVTPDFFRTTGIDITSGRGFTAQDRAGAPPVAIVNATAAGQLWPGQNPIGQRIRLGRSGRTPWMTVVGVAEPVPPGPLARGGPPALVYLPIAQHPQSLPADLPITLHIRTSGEPVGLPRELTAAVTSVDSDLMLESMATAEEANAAWRRPLRTTALLFLALAGVAVALALIGVYGVSAFAAIRRTREIGIRMALGATTSDAVRLILGEAARTALLGMAIGVLAALAHSLHSAAAV